MHDGNTWNPHKSLQMHLATCYFMDVELEQYLGVPQRKEPTRLIFTVLMNFAETGVKQWGTIWS